jgi:hypothetical protein
MHFAVPRNFPFFEIPLNHQVRSSYIDLTKTGPSCYLLEKQTLRYRAPFW